MLWSFNQIINSYVPDSNQHIHIHALIGSAISFICWRATGVNGRGWVAEELCPCLVLTALDSLLPCHPQCLPFTGTRKHLCTKNNLQIRQEGDWGYKQQPRGQWHPSWRQRHGGGCLSPRNSSISHLCIGTGNPQSLLPRAGTVHHPPAEITLCCFPGCQGLPEFGKHTPFCVPVLAVLTWHYWKLRRFRGHNKLHFLSLQGRSLLKDLRRIPSIQLHSQLSQPQTLAC